MLDRYVDLGHFEAKLYVASTTALFGLGVCEAMERLIDARGWKRFGRAKRWGYLSIVMVFMLAVLEWGQHHVASERAEMADRQVLDRTITAQQTQDAITILKSGPITAHVVVLQHSNGDREVQLYGDQIEGLFAAARVNADTVGSAVVPGPLPSGVVIAENKHDPEIDQQCARIERALGAADVPFRHIDDAGANAQDADIVIDVGQKPGM